jgi:hypothetical protein
VHRFAKHVVRQQEADDVSGAVIRMREDVNNGLVIASI